MTNARHVVSETPPRLYEASVGVTVPTPLVWVPIVSPGPDAEQPILATPESDAG
jgi:hypothetical protein